MKRGEETLKASNFSNEFNTFFPMENSLCYCKNVSAYFPSIRFIRILSMGNCSKNLWNEVWSFSFDTIVIYTHQFSLLSFFLQMSYKKIMNSFWSCQVKSVQLLFMWRPQVCRSLFMYTDWGHSFYMRLSVCVNVPEAKGLRIHENFPTWEHSVQENNLVDMKRCFSSLFISILV